MKKNFFQHPSKYQAYKRKRRHQTVVFFGVIILLAFSTLAIYGLTWFQGSPSSAYAHNEPSDVDYLTEIKNLDLSLLEREVDVEPDFFGLAHKKLLPVVVQKEDERLRNKLNQLFASYPDRFKPHLFYYNPDDGSYVDINGQEPVAAASVIKLPILFAYYQQQDMGWINGDTSLIYLDYHRTGGAGTLQYQPAGQELASTDVATEMIQHSDNTATNIMIDYLGGSNLLNRDFTALGLRQTRISNWLPDLEGTNTTSMKDMVTLLYNMDSGMLLSPESRYQTLDILKGTKNRRLIPARLPQGTVVAQKTGDIGTALANSGIIYLPDNRRIYLSVQVDRPFNDYTARDMIQEAAQIVYHHAVATKPINTLASTGTEPLKTVSR